MGATVVVMVVTCVPVVTEIEVGGVKNAVILNWFLKATPIKATGQTSSKIEVIC